MKEGKIKVSNKLAGKIRSGGKDYSIPRVFDLGLRATYHNKECQFELNDSTVVKIIVNSKEIGKNVKAVEAKIAKQAAKEVNEKQEKINAELEKKYGSKFKNDLFQECQGKISEDYKVFAPKDTLRINIASHQADNFALKLNKFATSTQGQTKDEFLFKQKGKGPNDELIPFFGDFPFDVLAKKQKILAESICQSKPSILEQKTDGRMIVGLGGASVYKTSMTLHHIYGIPYIPASSVKGIVRSWIICTFFGDVTNTPEKEQEYPLVNAEFRALTENEAFCKIFGCPSSIEPIIFKDKKPIYKKDEKGKPTKNYKKGEAIEVALKNKEGKGTEHRGNIIFFDAFPMTTPKIEADIMTPHYGDYYGDSDNKKNVAPTDTQSPIPIPFLTVADTKFQFIVGSKKEGLLENTKIQEKTIAQWLKEALTEHGIGAKTAVGYGYMTEVEE
jgi:CRISPR-associated protein Cmr6